MIEESIKSLEIDERQAVRNIIAKKKHLSRYQDRQKLLAYLMRQGFNYDSVKAELEEVAD